MLYDENCVVITPYDLSIYKAVKEYRQIPVYSCPLAGVIYNEQKHFNRYKRLLRLKVIVCETSFSGLTEFRFVEEEQLIIFPEEIVKEFDHRVSNIKPAKRNGVIMEITEGHSIQLGDHYCPVRIRPIEYRKVPAETLEAATRLRERLDTASRNIPEDIKREIIRMYFQNVPRSQIAEKLKINKTLLNWYISSEKFSKYE